MAQSRRWEENKWGGQKWEGIVPKKKKDCKTRMHPCNVTAPYHSIRCVMLRKQLQKKTKKQLRQHRGRLCMVVGHGELTCDAWESATKASQHRHHSCPTPHTLWVSECGGEREWGRTVTEDGWIRLMYVDTLLKQRSACQEDSSRSGSEKILQETIQNLQAGKVFDFWTVKP